MGMAKVKKKEMMQEKVRLLQGYQSRRGAWPGGAENGEWWTGGRPSPVLSASWLSRLIFWWFVPIFKISLKRPIISSDICDIVPWEKANIHVKTFSKRWDAVTSEERNESAKLFKLLIWHHKGYLSLILLLEFIREGLSFVEPLVVAVILMYLDGSHRTSLTTAWAAVMFCVLGSFIKVACIVHGYFLRDNVAMGMRTACVALIYKKALRLGTGNGNATSAGKIITLMSTDVEHFQVAIRNMPSAILGVFFFVNFIILGFIIIGPVMYLTIAIIVAFICVLFGLAKLMGKLRYEQCSRTDKRISFIYEILNQIRSIKIHGWEELFSRKAEKFRRSEMAVGIKSSLGRLFMSTSSYAIVKIAAYVSLSVFVVYNNGLRPEVAIKMIGLISGLRGTFLMDLPKGISGFYEGIASTNRIQKFLNLEERKMESFTPACPENKAELSLRGATAGWNGRESTVLNDINFSISSNDLVIVAGSVGSSKTSLLLALLGELPLREGTRSVRGSLAYVSQEPWLMSDTLQNNILFGRQMDTQIYENVLHVTGLDEDIHFFPHGDQSLVGEKGLLLSGGQKARVNLARALYQDADIYLLDDPLSAVDTKVGKGLFQKAICEYLQHKPRVVITHQLQYLPHADKVVIMEEGRIAMEGTYQEVITELPRYHFLSGGNVSEQEMSNKSVSENIGMYSSSLEETNKKKEGLPDKVKEKDQHGSVRYKVYLRYLAAGYGILLLPPIILLTLIYMVTNIASDWMLVHWPVSDVENTELEQLQPNITISSTNNATVHDRWATASQIWQIKTLLLVVAACMSLLLYNILFAGLVTLASKHLYNAMFRHVLRVPMVFFETTPTGNILNRFSRDTSAMDIQLVRGLSRLLVLVNLFLGQVVFACILKPWMTLPSVIFIAITGAWTFVMTRVSRDLNRLQASWREAFFIAKAYQMMDRHSAVWYYYISGSRFFSLMVELPSSLFVSSYILVSFLTYDPASGVGSTGLSLLYLISTFRKVHGVFKMMSEIESTMTSVERIQQYGELPQEALEEGELEPPGRWPEKAALSFRDVTLKYKDNASPSLGPISFDIAGGMKVGIVGRTGAGKSSLFTSLLRLVDPEGSIKIDGMNINKVALQDLRSNISVIPQDPALFTGTLRENLDPFNKHDENAIWTALQQVRLDTKVKELPCGIDADITDAGANLSAGEKQLFCLARALLKRNKIILLDEATANVDTGTDAIIQAAIEKECRTMTVLTIAHRLKTIITYDKILVLEHGKVRQYGEPLALMEDTRGLFYQMVDKMGPATVAEFRKLLINTAQRKEESAYL